MCSCRGNASLCSWSFQIIFTQTWPTLHMIWVVLTASNLLCFLDSQIKSNDSIHTDTKKCDIRFIFLNRLFYKGCKDVVVNLFNRLFTTMFGEFIFIWSPSSYNVIQCTSTPSTGVNHRCKWQGHLEMNEFSKFSSEALEKIMENNDNLLNFWYTSGTLVQCFLKHI